MKKKDTDIEGKPTIKERFADAVDISKEILLDTVLVTCIGNREMTVENCKGILEYTDVCIRIKTKQGKLKITGRHLELKNISKDLLYITGRIDSFCFKE